MTQPKHALLNSSGTPQCLIRHMFAAGLLTLAGMPQMAVADELSELKQMMKQMQQRIEQLESKQVATPPAAPASASPLALSPPPALAPAAAPAAAVAPSFQWKIYGRADLGVVRSNGKDASGTEISTTRLNQGQMASRLGITGSWAFNEEYKAIFGAETGLNLYSGNAGGGTQNNTISPVLFNRGAGAGLASKSWGSIEGGTMYMAPFWVMLGADQASANNYGLSDFSALFTVSRPEALARYLKDPVPSTANVSKTNTLAGGNSGTALFYSNSLRYRSPTFSNFSGELSYSMGQQARSSTPISDDGRTIAFNLLYKDGPLFAGFAHMDYLQQNDIATAGVSDWRQRHQVSDIIGARYQLGDFVLGGSYTHFKVSNAGGYKAQAYGLSGAYTLGKHRLEASVARVSYDSANASGDYGSNTGDGKGDPNSTSYALGYLYNLERNLSLYAYYNMVSNNDHAKLGTLTARGDNNFFGYSPSAMTIGSFFVF